MKYDLIAIDIDGTLVADNKIIAPPVYEAVQRVVQAGKKVVLCTGRPLPGAQPYVEELALDKVDDYMITYHGALVQRSDTLETILHHELTHQDLLNWRELTHSLGHTIQAVRNDGVFTDLKDLDYFKLMESYFNNIPLRIREIDEMNPDRLFSKLFMGDDANKLDQFEEVIPDSFREDYTILRSGPNSIEILNKKASKGQSLGELAELLKIPQKRVMAIGDSGNDVDMVEYAGLGVAMGNAVSEVKAVADVITKDADNFGVAHAINRYLFNE